MRIRRFGKVTLGAPRISVEFRSVGVIRHNPAKAGLEMQSSLLRNVAGLVPCAPSCPFSPTCHRHKQYERARCKPERARNMLVYAASPPPDDLADDAGFASVLVSDFPSDFESDLDSEPLLSLDSPLASPFDPFL